MAARDSSLRRKKSHGYGINHSYMASVDQGRLADATRMLVELEPAPTDLRERVIQLISFFVRDLTNVVSHMSKPSSIDAFYLACKERFKDLTKLNGVIRTDASDAECVNVYVELNSGTRAFQGRWDRRSHVYGLTLDDEILDLWTISERPGCYKWLFLADLCIISWAGETTSEEYNVWETASWLSTVVCSIGRIYEDIRPTKAMVLEEEAESLQRLRATHDLDHEFKLPIPDLNQGRSLWDLFQQVSADIKEGKLPYIRDISQALKRADLSSQSQYSVKDYHVSFKKTGSQWRKKAYPGLYASLYEFDKVSNEISKFDQYSGYESHYNREPLEGVYQPSGLTITIEQHKVNRRVIHMGPNPMQDRLNYVHRRIQKVLDLLPEDCTRDQSRGVDFAKLVTDPEYRNSVGNNVYSLDISKATDTIDMEFQVECLKLILPEDVVEMWYYYNTQLRDMRWVDNSIHQYVQLCGQAQGYKSSFPSFAWCHHVLMRVLMLACKLQYMKSVDFYRVLGDDSIMSCPDPKEFVLQGYIHCCSWINWSTNESKGYVARRGDQYAFAEFAKKRVLNGRIDTPIPSKLLLNAEKTATGTLALFQWVSINYKTISLVETWRSSPWLSTVFSEDDISVIARVASTGTMPCFEGWKEQRDSDPRLYSSNLLMFYSLVYFGVKLKSTLMDQLMPDNLRNVSEGGFDPSKLDAMMNSVDEEELLDLAQDSDNKYYTIIEMNEDMIKYINHIMFGGEDRIFSKTWAQLELQLTAEEENRIFRCLEILEMVSHGVVPNDVQGAYWNFQEAIKILTRFNPRGDARVTFQNGTLWGTILQRIERLDSLEFI